MIPRRLPELDESPPLRFSAPSNVSQRRPHYILNEHCRSAAPRSIMRRSPILTAVALAALLAGESGCLFRTRVVEMRTSTARLQTATKQELVDRINQQTSQIKTLNTTVEIATSVGGEKKGKVTDYEEVLGYILVRKPDMLRMIGLFPIVRNKAFDMVSDGTRFKLSIPAKNKFYVGSAEVTKPAANPLENLRPQVIYNALFLPEIDKDEIAVLENDTEEVVDAKTKKLVQQPDYVIDIIRRSGSDSGWYLYRKVLFERVHLVPHHQIVSDLTPRPGNWSSSQIMSSTSFAAPAPTPAGTCTARSYSSACTSSLTTRLFTTLPARSLPTSPIRSIGTTTASAFPW